MEEHKSITHLLAKYIFNIFKFLKRCFMLIVMILLHRWIGGNGFSTLMMPKLQITRGFATRAIWAPCEWKIHYTLSSYTGIEHSCMGEFRDMGIPAQVVKKKSCTSGEAASAGFFFLPRVQEFPCPYIRPYRKDIPL
jgi:hypothetical protein